MPHTTESDGAVLRTEHGDVLLVRRGGVSMDIHLHSRASRQHVECTEAYFRLAGPPRNSTAWLVDRLCTVVAEAQMWRELGWCEALEGPWCRAVAAAWRMRALEAHFERGTHPCPDPVGGVLVTEEEIRVSREECDALDWLAAELGGVPDDMDVSEAFDLAWERACGDEEEEERLSALQEAYDARYESISRTPAPVPSVEEPADEAAEEREERLAEERSEDRDERHALYDVLQASWSDAVYFSGRERLEAREAVEIGEADVPFVDYDDRHDGLE